MRTLNSLKIITIFLGCILVIQPQLTWGQETAEQTAYMRELFDGVLESMSEDELTETEKSFITEVSSQDLWRRIFISSDITNDYDARILVECYKSALRTVVNQRNLSQAEAEKEMRIWLSELQTGELTRIEFWDRVMECKGYCAPVMATLSVCLLYTYKDYLVAPIIFDFADSEYKENTEGDSRSRFETHCNSTVIKKAVIKANENPDNRILLVGRASRIGEKFRELKRSEDRVKSVISELYNWGIPNNKIYYRYLGYDEPQIYDKTAEVLNITDIFEGIGEHTINQSVMVYVYNPKKLEIPGAVQAMSRPIGY